LLIVHFLSFSPFIVSRCALLIGPFVSIFALFFLTPLGLHSVQSPTGRPPSRSARWTSRFAIIRSLQVMSFTLPPWHLCRLRCFCRITSSLPLKSIACPFAFLSVSCSQRPLRHFECLALAPDRSCLFSHRVFLDYRHNFCFHACLRPSFFCLTFAGAQIFSFSPFFFF